MKTNQTTPGLDLDASHAEIKNLIPGLKNAEPAPTDKKPEEKPAVAPVIDPAKKPEEKPEAPADPAKPTEEPKAPIVEPKPEDAKSRTQKDENPTDKRPSKYIPIQKYVEEKKVFNDTIKGLEEKLKKFSDKPEGDDRDAKIKAFAEKNGYEVSELKELIGLIDVGDKIPDATLKELAETKAAKDAAEQKLAQQEETILFKKEVDTVAIPAWKAKYKNVPQEKLDEAFEELDRIAHTEKYHKYDLDYIIYKESALFDKILGEAAPGKKGPETSRASSKQATTVYASDFKGKKDFSALASLEPQEVAKVVDAMDIQTYSAFSEWIKNGNDSFTVEKGAEGINQNRTIRLK